MSGLGLIVFIGSALLIAGVTYVVVKALLAYLNKKK
jgi:hypothetical protein